MKYVLTRYETKQWAPLNSASNTQKNLAQLSRMLNYPGADLSWAHCTQDYTQSTWHLFFSGMGSVLGECGNYTGRVWGICSQDVGSVLTGYGICTQRVWDLYLQGTGSVLYLDDVGSALAGHVL